jgi:hypothetical protein
MDNVQKHNNYINIPSSQTFRSYKIFCLKAMDFVTWTVKIISTSQHHFGRRSGGGGLIHNFFNWYSGEGGVQLGPLGTAATNRPIVPALGDYDDGEIDGMMIGRGTEVLGENLPQCRFVHHKFHMQPGPPRWEDSD